MLVKGSSNYPVPSVPIFRGNWWCDVAIIWLDMQMDITNQSNHICRFSMCFTIDTYKKASTVKICLKITCNFPKVYRSLTNRTVWTIWVNVDAQFLLFIVNVMAWSVWPANQLSNSRSTWKQGKTHEIGVHSSHHLHATLCLDSIGT